MPIRPRENPPSSRKVYVRFIFFLYLSSMLVPSFFEVDSAHRPRTTRLPGSSRWKPDRSRRKSDRGESHSETSHPPRVALLVETSTLFGRKLLSGIAQYIRETRPWLVHITERSVNDVTPSWLQSWNGDGIISRIASPDIRDAIQEKNIPVIDLNEQLDGMGIPMISNDHTAIGVMVADHLLDRGFQRFAFLGHSGYRWNDVRREAFQQKVTAKGYPCLIYPDKAATMTQLKEGDWQTELDSIAQWVASLEKPVGIMTAGDYRGVQLLTACGQAHVAVPEQAAVVGVGADDVACQFAYPPLSSVMLNAWRMGYEAAALLDRMMRGEPAPQKEILIPPLDILVRRSSDVTAIHDPMIAKAMHFIRENAREGINVEAVLRCLGVSRTTLQNRFRAYMNRSIHDVVIEMKLTFVKEMLIETSLPISEVSARCGFQHPEYMSTALKKHTGWSPARYRQQYGRDFDEQQ